MQQSRIKYAKHSRIDIQTTRVRYRQQPLTSAARLLEKELLPQAHSLAWCTEQKEEKNIMGKAFILWICGVPTGIIAILWLFGFLH